MGEGKEEPEGFRKKKGKGRGGEQDATPQATRFTGEILPFPWKRIPPPVRLEFGLSVPSPVPLPAPLCSAPPPGCVRPAPLCRAERWHDACARRKKKKKNPPPAAYISAAPASSSLVPPGVSPWEGRAAASALLGALRVRACVCVGLRV